MARKTKLTIGTTIIGIMENIGAPSNTIISRICSFSYYKGQKIANLENGAQLPVLNIRYLIDDLNRTIRVKHHTFLTY